MIKYDHDKLIETLRAKYRELYGKTPSQAADRVIDCIDDAFMDEWRREVLEIDRKLQCEAKVVQETALSTIAELNKKIDTAKESGVIEEKRVSEALQAYMTIVKMNFDTPQQKLQNIQNASYFIWALYAQDSPATNAFFNNYGEEKATNVKQEPSSQVAGRRIERY